LGGTWVDVTSIDSIISSANGTLTVVSDGVTYLTDDENVIELLKQFK
jgi:hypothetical protein